MAIVQISKIQHRTGANIDLPQLDEGEIGFSTDEQKLFIGNDPILFPVPEGQTTTQLEILTEVSNLDFAKVIGSANTELQITSPKVGQLLVADGSSNTMVATTFVNWTGNLLGNGVAHSNNKLHLGGLANIEITGGMNGGVLSTDGAGNLYWTTVAGGGGGDGLPAQNNNSGKYLKTNGTVATWENVFSDTNFATTVRSNISVGYNSGYGNLSYSSSNGVITFTGVSPSDIRSQFSAGTGVTYDSANGQFSIAQDVSASASPTFDNLTLSNVTISGLYQVDDPQLQVPTVRNGIVYNNNSNTLATNNEFYYQGSVLHVGKVETLETITTGTTFKIANIDNATKAPNDPGFKGEICWDANYIYVCTEGDGFTATWEKVELGSTVTSTPDLSNYATQSDVSNAVANLVNSAPSALNTLYELANALGNDASYSSTITTALGTKANSADLATVATSGSYTDLTNKPALFSGSYADLTNKPTLFGGSYNDLTDKPNLFDGAYSSLTGKPTIPTSTSNLTNDSGFITLADIPAGSGFSGSYNDLSDKPTLFSGSYLDLTNKPTLFGGSYNDLTDKPTLFSGSYADLSNKPTLFDGEYASLANKPTLFSGSYADLTNKPTIPSIGNIVFNGENIVANNTNNDIAINPANSWDNGNSAYIIIPNHDTGVTHQPIKIVNKYASNSAANAAVTLGYDSNDNSKIVTVYGDGSLNSTGNISADGDISTDGNVVAVGNVTATGDLTGSNLNLNWNGGANTYRIFANATGLFVEDTSDNTFYAIGLTAI